MLEYLILGSLTINDMSGYEIKKLMSNSTAFFSNISDGSLYPTLNRCEKNGLVRGKELVENGRYKKIYEITDEGRKVFTDWLQAPLKPFMFRYEILIRMFFARNLSRADFLSLIDQHIQQLTDLNEQLQNIEKKQAKHIDEFQLATLHFGRDFYDFLITWYEKYVTEMEGSDGGNYTD